MNGHILTRLRIKRAPSLLMDFNSKSTPNLSTNFLLNLEFL